MMASAFEERSARVLPPGHVDVWFAKVADCTHAALLQRYEGLLSAPERERWQRFVFERDRHIFLVTRALVRTVLALYVGGEPSALTFGAAYRGKPHLLDANGIARPPFFNVSHTRGMVMLALSPDRRVGVDLECMDREAPLSIASHYFSVDEARALQVCEPAMRTERFWSLWTLKETLLKASGQGLYAGLDSFGFELDQRPGEIALQTSAEAVAAGLGGAWWFGQWFPACSYMAALGVEVRQDNKATSPVVSLREVVPLSHEKAVSLAFIRTSPPA